MREHRQADGAQSGMLWKEAGQEYLIRYVWFQRPLICSAAHLTSRCMPCAVCSSRGCPVQGRREGRDQKWASVNGHTGNDGMAAGRSKGKGGKDTKLKVKLRGLASLAAESSGAPSKDEPELPDPAQQLATAHKVSVWEETVFKKVVQVFH